MSKRGHYQLCVIYPNRRTYHGLYSAIREELEPILNQCRSRYKDRYWWIEKNV